jgi:hypothetical protein
MQYLKKNAEFTVFFLVLSFGVFFTFSAQAQTTQKTEKDPCEQTKFQLSSSDPITFTLSDIEKLPQCFDGKFIRLVGVYRIAFENSDLYDPIEKSSAWLTFDPFYPAIKRCSSSEALKLLNRESGGTFGIVAMGIINSNGSFGHMSGWKNQFQMICLEEIKDFSKYGLIFQAQPNKVQKQISDWYTKKMRD